jgi:hypothetical protein
MLLIAVLVPLVLATVVGLWLTWPGDQPRSAVDVGFGQRPVQGDVLTASSAPCASGGAGVGQDKKCVSLAVRLADGDSPGVVIQQVLPDEPSTPRFAVGDHVVLGYTAEIPPRPRRTRSRISSEAPRCCGWPHCSPPLCCCSAGGEASRR